MFEIELVNDKIFTEPFARYIAKSLKAKILGDLEEKKLKSCQKYLEKLGLNFSAKDIVLQGTKNIIYKKIDTKEKKGYIIFISPNATIDKTNIKIIDMVKLLNNGTIEVMGYPIFEDSFESIKNNMGNYINMFLFGGGILCECLSL